MATSSKKRHVKWRGKYITIAEHEVGVREFGPRFKLLVEPLLRGTDLCARCRFHRDPDAPCVYVFRTEALAEQNRGLVFHVQLAPDRSFVEMILRQWLGGKLPVDVTRWKSLQPNTWEPSKTKWKGYRIFETSDVEQARILVRTCIDRYDVIYGS